ncbi:MAG: glycosyltransferase family 4 protein [Anaerosomatales bacterium]|nr:glycosyltransferase family 4 protein [Coriobacteriia bacterium]MDI6692646.1 glycosyltransferase family 4 protein [Anaerosomatales bacterium]GAV30933.1 glycosyltransferase [Coriobacteriaceae bacterium EMTCatB1]
MRIGMLLPNHRFPPDIRVEKEAQVLAGAGHEVFVLCRRDADQPAEEQVGPVRAIRHSVHPESTVMRKADSLRYLLTMDSPSWRAGMESLITEHGCEALHLHDLPYIPSALKAARAHGVPVILDLHENYSAALALWGRSMRTLFFSPARAARLEKWALRRVDRVVVVVDEARDRVVGLGTDPAKVTIFGNTESVNLVPAEPLPLDFSAGPRLVYVGGVAAHRGLDTALKAMPHLLEREPRAVLTIVGDGAAMPELRALATELNLGESVRFTGWLGKDEAMAYIAEANIALVPHHRSPHTDATIPHKLFQYMALGRPVLVSDCAPLARIVGATGAGMVFRSGDERNLAEKVIELADPRTAAEMAASGRKAVLDRWNLEAEAPALVRLYDSLG